MDAPVDVTALESDNAALREALRRIEAWDGFPRVPDRLNPGQTISYGFAYGSNGERDFMRKVARDALAQPHPGAALLEELQRIRARVAHLEERERHIAQVLGVVDGGQFRNDWDGAVARLKDKEWNAALDEAAETADGGPLRVRGILMTPSERILAKKRGGK